MHQLVTPSRHHPGELLILGETTYRRTQHRFGLLPEDRLRHLWLVGKTVSGTLGNPSQRAWWHS